MRDDEARAKALTREIYGDNPITANMADDPKLASEASRRDGGRIARGTRRGRATAAAAATGPRPGRDRSRDRSGGRTSSSAAVLRAGEPRLGRSTEAA